MGSSVYGLAHHRGVQKGIEIGLKMAAEAAKQRRVQIASTVLNVVQMSTPAVLHFVMQQRAEKAKRAA